MWIIPERSYIVTDNRSSVIDLIVQTGIGTYMMETTNKQETTR